MFMTAIINFSSLKYSNLEFLYFQSMVFVALSM